MFKFSNRGVSTPIIIGIITILVIVIGVGMFIYKYQGAPTQKTGILTEETGTSIQKAPEKSPKDIYMAYRDALKKGDAEQVKTYISTQRREQFEQRAKAQGIEEKQFIELINSRTPATFEVTDEKINGNSAALLKLFSEKPDTGLPGSAYGYVTFINENNEWKIQDESWNSSNK